MMEIKFRIYFEDEEPFISEPITLEDLLHGEDIEFRNEDDTLSLTLNDFRFFYKRNQNYKIMQFTGLHDKNGKEIYEGDIVKLTNGGEIRIGKVIYEYSGFTIDVMNMNKPYGRVCFGMLERCIEVIGNIYENPELLERSSNGD